MTARDRLPSELLLRLRPSDVQSYLRLSGWTTAGSLQKGVVAFRNPQAKARNEIVLPIDRDFADYEERMAEVVGQLAALDPAGRSALEILVELVLPPADILKYRLIESRTEEGFLPVPDAVDLILGCRQSLLAAACTVVEPQPFHPRLSRAEAETFLSACKLATERGSFVATVMCPLDAVVPDNGSTVAQLSLLPSLEQTETFSRKAVKTVMQSADRVVRAIESGRIDDVIGNIAGGPPLSANLCEALVAMEPRDAHGSLEIRCTWSRRVPMPKDVPELVVFKREYFPYLSTIAHALRPSPPDPKESVYAGRVESLHGQPGEDQLVGGDVVLSFLGDDEQPLRARISLPPAAYALACDAHKFGHYVTVRGLLKRGPRVGRIEQPSDFRDLSTSGKK